MSYQDPVTIDGSRASAKPVRDQGEWFVAIEVNAGRPTWLTIDDARGFLARVSFAVELAERTRMEDRVSRLESAWSSTRSGAV